MLIPTTKLSDPRYSMGQQVVILTLLLINQSIVWSAQATTERFNHDGLTETTTIKGDNEASSLANGAPRIHNKRHGTALEDHAPKLLHQPQSVLVKPNEPHTIECPIESQPTAEVKWFKDNQLLASQPPRLEQMGNELMFIQMMDDDTGEYHCEATNYLGSVTSDHFKLTVQSSIHEPKIRFEPRLAEVDADQQVEFTCTIPATTFPTNDRNNQAKSRRQRPPEVSWKRNGARLLVKWLDVGEGPTESRNRFVARQTPANGNYVLTITRAQLKDDNATFTCLYRQQEFSPSDEDDDSSAQGANSELFRESSPVKLRVYNKVKLDLDLAPPIEDLDLARIPNEIPRSHNSNYTTQLLDPRSPLYETLMDLYETAKPALVIIGLVSLISMFIVLQFVIIRRRNRQNRYMKHQYSSSGSGSSGGSSAAGASSIDCDPVLNSLMARTLSAPSAASLSGAGKKFRSYRDHMRKVAAANDLANNDLVDGHYFRQQQAQFSIPSAHQVNDAQEPFFTAAAALGQANLYNQSLAAREQARSLLQASEHMRSLSNLNNCHKGLQNQQGLRLSQNGSHLNLPLSFAFGGANNHRQQSGLVVGSSQLMANALWQPHLAQMAAMMQQQQQQQQQHHSTNQASVNHKNHQDEHYQLVNCSSISPSSTSSSNQLQHQRQISGGEFDQNNSGQPQQHSTKDGQNHYSIIENNDEDDSYEEVDQSQAVIKRSRGSKMGSSPAPHHQQEQDNMGVSRTSTFVMDHKQATGNNNSIQSSSNHDGINQKSSLRSSLTSNSSTSWGQGDPNANASALIFDIGFNRLGSKRKSQDKQAAKSKPPHLDKRQDQLSPYAVSSICGSMPPPPPPVTSEAMQALNEQFDINHLMILDESTDNQSLSFNAPPPPPIPQPVNSNNEGHRN